MKLIEEIKIIPTQIKLLIGTAILGFVGYLVAENPLHLTDFTCQLIIYNTICVIFVALMTIDLVAELFNTESWLRKLFLSVGIPLFLAYITTAILMQGESFHYYQINFWVCLTCWVISYVLRIEHTYVGSEDGKLKKQNAFENFIVALSAAWTISSVFITLGTSIFDYGKHPISKLQEIHSLLDLRINLAIIIAVLVAVKSIVTVLQTKTVELKPLFKPREQTQKSENETGTKNILQQGFSTFLNLAINLLASLGNIFYKAIATVVVYLFFIGGEIFNSIALLIKKSVNLIFYVIVIAAVITGFYYSQKIGNPLLLYLRENSWASSFFPLLWVLLYAVIVSVCMITVNYFTTIKYKHPENKIERDEEAFNIKLTRVMQRLPYLVAVIWVTGVLLFLLALIDFLKFTTFTTFGILSTFLSAIVFVGFVIYLINNFTRSKPKPTTDSTPPKGETQGSHLK